MDSDAAHQRPKPSVQLLGTLPPWKGISAYCERLYEGIRERYDAFRFTGWRRLYPTWLYPGGDPTTPAEPVVGPDVERPLAWYDPLSWLRVGLADDVDLLHAQWWSYPLAIPYVVVFLTAKAGGKTVLLTVHNVDPHEQTALTSLLNDAVYRFADEYVVHSTENRSQLRERAGVGDAPIHVIRHPTIGPEKRGIETAAARRHLDLSPDAAVVLFFGNVRDYKGLDSLIEMVGRLNEDRDVELLVAGKCWVDWAPYRALVRRAGIEDCVHRYEGYVPEADLEYFFAAADVVALPYDEFDAQSGVASLADHFGTVSVGYDEGGLAAQVDRAVSTVDAFEDALLDAFDAELSKHSPDDDPVAAHVDLYRAIAESTDRPTPTVER